LNAFKRASRNSSAENSDFGNQQVRGNAVEDMRLPDVGPSRDKLLGLSGLSSFTVRIGKKVLLIDIS
jgi:hypothetical protein